MFVRQRFTSNIPETFPGWGLVCAGLIVGIFASSSEAQFFNNGGFQRSIGGVSVDAEGAVRDALVEDQDSTLERMRENLAGGKAEFANESKLRMISLKAVQAAMVLAAETGKPLSEEILLLGGLTRIEMVFVYPDKQDIVIAGPSEDWTIAKNGSVVGKKSGRPIVYLDDLITLFNLLKPHAQKGLLARSIRRLRDRSD